jgi:fumarate hydratase subunit alpha
MLSKEILIETAVKLLRKAETDLPVDVEEALKKAHREEREKLGGIQLKEILENIKYARENHIPLCQDTGIINFYVKIGDKTGISPEEIEKTLRKATKLATGEIPLRPNAVNPLTRENTGDNTGTGIPYVEIEYLKGEDYLEITAFPKGAGSENMSRLKMLKPSDGIKGVKRFVLESVAEAKGNPCPPGVIGIGVGGSSDLATKMAKKALLRKIGERNKDKETANLEEELEEAINKLGIGAMGLGGTVSCLSVAVEVAHTHTGSLPVAVNIGCWATRKATVRIYKDRIVFL